jgi:exonuclease III
MKLQTIILNVQGLNRNEAPYLLQNYLKDKLRDLDIICLQEHKLRGAKLLALGEQFWKGTTYLAYDASHAYNHITSDPRADSEGICMFISPAISHLLHASSSLLHNQAQWALLKGLPRENVGILNVYAPQTPAD